MNVRGRIRDIHLTQRPHGAAANTRGTVGRYWPVEADWARGSLRFGRSGKHGRRQVLFGRWRLVSVVRCEGF